MTKLFLCLLLSAFVASLVHKWEWERTVRHEWREVATYYRDLDSLTAGPASDR